MSETHYGDRAMDEGWAGLTSTAGSVDPELREKDDGQTSAGSAHSSGATLTGSWMDDDESAGPGRTQKGDWVRRGREAQVPQRCGVLTARPPLKGFFG